MEIERLFTHAWGLPVKDFGQLIVGLFLAGLIPGVVVAGIAVFALVLAVRGLATASAADDAELALTAAGVVVLAVAGVAALAIVVLVAIPLYAGVLRGALRRVREDRETGYWDLFSGFHVFGRAVGVYLLACLVVPLAAVAAPAAVVTTPFSLTWLLAMYFQLRREDWMIDATLAARLGLAQAPSALNT